ncbi:MAG: D-lysine 5,6-aminomutase subunit alpha, partial [Candidatus Eremiobacteraeota bacterium]|nr:D-lysine 5,6-aminomutase subunit alpha [Candidatus Eremiobacteraeota bacterium]
MATPGDTAENKQGFVVHLELDRAAVAHCRELARRIVDPVEAFIEAHSTVSVERAVARLLGCWGALPNGVPLANVFVDALGPERLRHGTALALGRLMAWTGHGPTGVCELLAARAVDPGEADGVDVVTAKTRIFDPGAAALAHIDIRRTERAQMLARLPQGEPPLLYVIVASGNIYEDRTAAVAAADAGAQIIAVIRSTGQSLLDYVPEGATTEGFGGTYATQENFRIMRAALDEASERLGRYVMLTNYASGLCMPEIAALAALERLDMLLNDSMYGILFRDINMRRTFIDQHFSRMLNAFAGIIINTGEDNYLTTADAVEQAPAVLASQFINEEFAHRAGLPDEQLGLGDAFEIDPDLEDGFLFQLAQAQLARQIFPNAPLKYMPPTKHMTGDIFKGHLMDGMFDLTSVMTHQTIHLCGMLTEAIHTPLLGDRALSLEGARYIMGTARHLGDELEIKRGGKIEQRANDVLHGA